MHEIVTRRLECGATLLVEHIPGVASAAFNWRLPAGCALDADARDGVASFLSEMVFRGAGGRSSREHSDALDRLGVQRSANVLTHHLQINATMLGERVREALPLLTDMVVDPALPDDALEPVRSLCLQSLESLDDDPQHLAMLRLAEQHRDAPYNRHGYGTRAGLEAIDLDDVRTAWRSRFVPADAIFAAAGAVDAERLAADLDAAFAGWSGDAPELPARIAAPRGVRHIRQNTAQVHIGIAMDAPTAGDPDAVRERLSVGVLGGSTSGRLFTEVRQKRALCYSVGASYRGARDTGALTIYAGTTPERAQETLDICLAEVVRLGDGITPEEFERAVIQLKSRIVMTGESTPARSASLAADQFNLDRTRSLDERVAEIDAVTLDEVQAYLADRALGRLTIVTLGPEPLEVADDLTAAASTTR